MSVVINTNYAATVASNNLAASNASLQKSLNRLSSGSKIVSPADDAGGLAVSMKLSAAAIRQGAVATNISNAISFLQTQDGALKVTAKVLERISELKVLYTDVTKSSSDKANYDAEFVALTAQLRSTALEKFNGVTMFGSAAIGQVDVTEDGGTQVAIASRNLLDGTSGVGTISASTITSLGDAAVTLANISTAIQNVATMRANNGSEQSRFNFASELVIVNKSNLESANSRIVDVDVATESTQLARWNVLVQAGTSMLSQANTSSQTALKLLQ
ncbi:flagellin [Opitutus terrae]|uniref:Flagellin n=1 Tax=Opitutus terrae (strain DSM 11246 / JCM 15787 / PB90-1) TaxID=452637 RepID=B1ZRP4_OPITP|nr:flagellin [Opitutus terrae]ACB73737.1 flagellin domain protein [Opitutus terrae PB90-1]